MNKKISTKKTIIYIIGIYLLIGFAYGMYGEVRLAKKYGVSRGEMLKDKWVYIRAGAMSPLWPITIPATIMRKYKIEKGNENPGIN